MIPSVAWLLDTNVVSEMMRLNPEPRVAGFLDRIAGEGIGLAAITVWEILNGIGRLDSRQRREDLAEQFQGILDDFFEGRILDWSAADARACARIMEDKRLVAKRSTATCRMRCSREPRSAMASPLSRETSRSSAIPAPRLSIRGRMRRDETVAPRRRTDLLGANRTMLSAGCAH